ncbi:MAG: tetratricopeptide repeat protein [Crocinitomicaceae bacterium]|nr:tetratricopeptide repeat protein [Crocinitomicaceae bacterium]
MQTQKEQAEKEQQFKDFVAAGDAAYNSKDYQKALASYQEAIKIKPDPSISQKIGQLNTLISQQSEQEQQEQRYKSKIGEADAAFTAKSWESARELYREALMIKPNDTYATNRITEIEKQMKLETDAEVEANYQKNCSESETI